jgi:hypothetical protein
VIDQEAGNARVVLAVVGRIVRLVPADLELVPSAYAGFAYLGDRDSVGTTPAVADLAVCGYGQANDHGSTPRAKGFGAGDRQFGDRMQVLTPDRSAGLPAGGDAWCGRSAPQRRGCRELRSTMASATAVSDTISADQCEIRR